MKKSIYFSSAVLLYVVSMGLPVYGFYWTFLGYKAAYMGAAAFSASEPFLAISWLSNIGFLANVFLPSKFVKIRSILAILTIAMSLFVYVDYKSDLMPGLGFFVWFSSFLLMFVHQIRTYRKTSIA